MKKAKSHLRFIVTVFRLIGILKGSLVSRVQVHTVLINLPILGLLQFLTTFNGAILPKERSITLPVLKTDLGLCLRIGISRPLFPVPLFSKGQLLIFQK